jgi:excisionase family DNA binding protein
MTVADQLLSVEQVAERLGTSVRFPRRLVEERRIAFVKVGRHVRIRESVLDAYLAANTVEPRRMRHLRGVV